MNVIAVAKLLTRWQVGIVSSVGTVRWWCRWHAVLQCQLSQTV